MNTNKGWVEDIASGRGSPRFYIYYVNRLKLKTKQQIKEAINLGAID